MFKAYKKVSKGFRILLAISSFYLYWRFLIPLIMAVMEPILLLSFILIIVRVFNIFKVEDIQDGISTFWGGLCRKFKGTDWKKSLKEFSILDEDKTDTEV